MAATQGKKGREGSDKNGRTKRNGESAKKGLPKAPFSFPFRATALFCLLTALCLIISLVVGNPADPSIMGRAGAWVSHFLIRLFGWGAFWPAPLLLVASWFLFKRRGVHLGMILTVMGWLLFLFATLAFLSLVQSDISRLYPKTSGGGSFGLFLARAVTEFSGKIGAGILLPLLAALGFFTACPAAWRRARGLLVFTWPFSFGRKNSADDSSLPPKKTHPVSSPKIAASSKNSHSEDSEIDLGLVVDPIVHAALPPVIIEKASPPAPQPKRPAPVDTPKPDYLAPGSPYLLPELDLLDDPPPNTPGHSSGLSRDELMENAHLLESKLRDFGVEGRVQEVSGGPVITMYEYQPAPGIKISKVAGLADDLTMAMRAISIRVVAPLPGKAAIGLEIPNPKRTLVTFKEVVESPVFQNSSSPLTLVLGVDIMGEPVIADLAKMPHLLIAGATGSGKSVGLGAMIMSILYKAPPDKVHFLMIDPKCVELALYKDIAHLIYPVLSDPTEATLGLKWAVAEMDLRYKLLAEKGVRNIQSYNDKIQVELKDWHKNPPKSNGDSAEEPPKELPYLVIIIDELADLMMVAAKEVEVYITRLAQKARACGIHLILATQRPSVDVLTGIIKANMPTRISFQVSSRIDSRTILDQMGAEKLLGAGDMLFMPPGVGKIRRLHGAYVSDEEIKKVTDFVRQWGPPDYLEDLTLPEPEANEDNGEKDEKYDEAVELVCRSQKATISHVQRHLRIGYNRAARIIEDMEREGIIGPQDGTRPRTIF